MKKKQINESNHLNRSNGSRPDDQIIILGCGLSGMITALSLANSGFRVTILESNSITEQSFFSDPRTTAITALSKAFFKQIGLWDSIEHISGPIKDIYVVDNKSPQMIHFDSISVEPHSQMIDKNITDSIIARNKNDKNNEYMGYLVLNCDFKKLLLKAVIKHNNITILDQVTYTKIHNNTSNKMHNNDTLPNELIDGLPDKNSITPVAVELIDGRTIKGSLVITCDGRNSKAKSRFFSQKIYKDYGQKAITFIVKHEKPHESTAVEHFMPHGPFAILPLKDQYKSSIVWTVENTRCDALLNLPEPEFEYLVQENFGLFLGKISIENEIKAFPLSAILMNKYVNKRIILIADTAHVIHPLAGQGLNQGIKDIVKLTELISKYGINQHSLKQYELARTQDNQNMLEITDAINTVFSSNSKALYYARQAGFNAIENIAAVKKMLMKYAMGHRAAPPEHEITLDAESVPDTEPKQDTGNGKAIGINDSI